MKNYIIIKNKIENINIESDKITYDQNTGKIISSGNVEIKFENKERKFFKIINVLFCYCFLFVNITITNVINSR